MNKYGAVRWLKPFHIRDTGVTTILVTTRA